MSEKATKKLQKQQQKEEDSPGKDHDASSEDKDDFEYALDWSQLDFVSVKAGK